jgi:hypothetical protein
MGRERIQYLHPISADRIVGSNPGGNLYNDDILHGDREIFSVLRGTSMRRYSLLAAGIGAVVMLFAPWAWADVGVLNGLTHVQTASPGSSNSVPIVLKNFGDRTETVRAYLLDYSYSFDGKSTYPDPGSLPRSNAPWVSFFPQRLALRPGETAEIACMVKVPNDRALTGTYWSMLMVEPVVENPNALAKTADGKVQIGIRQVVRYGIQMVTHIGDSGKRDIRILGAKLVKEGEKAFLQVDVLNTGERALRPALNVEMFKPNGESFGRFEGDRSGVFPGTSTRYKVDLTKVPAGTYKAMIVLDNKDDYVFGAEYQLIF